MLEARENVHHQVVIRFSLVSGWLRSSRQFPNQSQSEGKENQCKPELLAYSIESTLEGPSITRRLLLKRGNKKCSITSRKIKWEIEIGKVVFLHQLSTMRNKYFSEIIIDILFCQRLRQNESDRKRKRLHRMYIFSLLVYFFASAGL